MNKHIKPILFSLSSLSLALASTSANAHGYMVFPQDYAYSCYTGTTSDPTICSGVVKAQKNEINANPAGNHKAAILDGKLCSASRLGDYDVLNIPSKNRYTTTLLPDANGEIEIQYMPTAAHRTWYWDYFVTRDGFNPDTDELTWADLERIAVIDAQGAAPGKNNEIYRTKLKWPDDKSGKRILYQVWQRPNPAHYPHEVLGKAPSNVWDSPEAFYSCANVYVAPENGGITPEPELPWSESQRFAAEPTAIDLGYTVAARIMDRHGSEQVIIPLDITAANIHNDRWKIELAKKINNDSTASQFVKVGVKNNNNEITLDNDPAKNAIFFKNKGWSHLIESHNNESNHVDFEVHWSTIQEEYVFKYGQEIKVPLNIYVSEYSRLLESYTYTAVVNQIGQSAEKPVATFSGVLAEQETNEVIKLNQSGSYNVNVTVTNSRGYSENKLFHFDVIQETEQPGGELPSYDYVFPNGLESYKAGTKVKAFDGHVYQCKNTLASGYCKQWTSSSNQFEPGRGSHWNMAWDKI